MSQPRLSNGRFTYKQAQQQQAVARGATIQNFRNGALYRVTGGPVARYKGQVKGYAVFTVHGKPLAVDVTRVRLADKEDVQAYLADAK